ncbi:MAG TPA: sulfite exporter TauE/SafE family protein [bacterium]|nr:sulfite exporter TauE/SafE family protein [bacterium]HOL49269.1 sulfite exporter TauE/SafE family protein [bacterium]HPO51746.1 sulfite exporter TauE/SafE family protein [bacterium]HXK44566.1 sulfite exporter TauE/SafE family protein [bacterium]
MTPVHTIESLLTGLIAGFICGLTGMGGGTIYVPVFYFLFGFSIKKAIGTSLLVIFISSVSAFFAHARGRQIDFKMSIYLVVSGIIGAQIGSAITARLPDIAVKIFFICLTMFLSFNMWRDRKNEVESCPANMNFSPVKLTLIGLTGGVISGMGGVGGAIVLVPLLHLCCGVPMNICIGTTLSVVIFNSLSGVIGYFYHNLVDVQTGTVTGIVAVFTAVAGAKLSMKTPTRKLRKIFSVILLMAGLAVVFGR